MTVIKLITILSIYYLSVQFIRSILTSAHVYLEYIQQDKLPYAKIWNKNKIVNYGVLNSIPCFAEIIIVTTLVSLVNSLMLYTHEVLPSNNFYGYLVEKYEKHKLNKTNKQIYQRVSKGLEPPAKLIYKAEQLEKRVSKHAS